MDLQERQQVKKEIILRCLTTEMTAMEAALILGLTERAVYQNMARYRHKGDKAFIHGNCGKRRRVSPERDALKKRILNIFQNTRIDGVNPFEKISYAYFTQVLFDDFGIKVSVSWVKKILIESGYTTIVRYRRRKNAQHLLRPRKEHFGELAQADGSEHDWFDNGKKYCIQGFLDDATSIPLGLYMTKNECLYGYIEATRTMASTYGLPMSLYPDRAGIFFVNNQKNDVNSDTPHVTQFGQMMEKLGVEMFPAHSPQAKGRIERFWSTLQQQLPVQFKLHGIKTIDEANVFLNNVYIPRFIKYYSVKPRSEESFFVRPSDMNEVTAVLKATYPAKTDNGGGFSLKGYRFCCDLPRAKINICINERDGIWVTPVNSTVRHEVRLVETDTTGSMPEVLKLLIEKVFLKNAKPLFREVYIDIDDSRLARFASKKSKSVEAV